jgi:hypothetical protein
MGTLRTIMLIHQQQANDLYKHILLLEEYVVDRSTMWWEFIQGCSSKDEANLTDFMALAVLYECEVQGYCCYQAIMESLDKQCRLFIEKIMQPSQLHFLEGVIKKRIEQKDKG